jgi:hypothetical protein
MMTCKACSDMKQDRRQDPPLIERGLQELFVDVESDEKAAEAPAASRPGREPYRSGWDK